MKRQTNGFTLIESLLVLSIFSVLSLTVLIPLQPAHEKLTEQHFFEQFQKDILYAQQHAIMERLPYLFTYNEDGTSYSIKLGRHNANELLVSRSLPEGITILPGTLDRRLTFLANGNISASGTLRVVIRQQAYLVTFYLGKGRFLVKKI